MQLEQIILNQRFNISLIPVSRWLLTKLIPDNLN